MNGKEKLEKSVGFAGTCLTQSGTVDMKVTYYLF